MQELTIQQQFAPLVHNITLENTVQSAQSYTEFQEHVSSVLQYIGDRYTLFKEITDEMLSRTADHIIHEKYDDKEEHKNIKDPLAWRDKTKSAEQRANLLVDAMTFEEKALTVTGHIFPGAMTWTGATEAIERLKVPRVRYQDGPQGVRMNIHWGTTTQWPSVLAFGQTWDDELVTQWGQHMGKEFKDKGAGVQLGPGLNVMRIGNNGRDFEYLSGEDPFIGASLVGPLVKGIQSNGVMANMKHYINNNQETHRWGQSANVDERTQYEMYYPPFEAAIKAGVGSAMCSYNKVNHVSSCANNKTLNRDLRDIMGFEGFVMSDWGAVYGNPKDYIPAGCDQEQGSVFRHYTERALYNDVKSEDLDKAVYRIVKSFIKFGLYDEELPDRFTANVTSQEHQDFAKKGVEESTILLKNDNETLPLKMKKGMKILILGNQAGNPTIHGSGSGQIAQNYIFSPLQAVCKELGVEAIANWVPFDKKCNDDTGNCVSYIALPNTNGSWFVSKLSAKLIKILVEGLMNYITQTKYDATIIFQGQESGEGHDRSTLDWDQSVFQYLKMIPYSGKVIGCMVGPGPMLTNNMRKYADAILFNVFPGQQYSNGLMNVIFGRANPSAKLTFTMPNIDNEQRMTQSQFPGDDNGWNSTYTEKHHFGYRWYDQYNVKPAFEFGHGLSYTTFYRSNWKYNPKTRTMNLTVQNTGKMVGSEIIQLYVEYPETENVNGNYKSPKVLRGYHKAKNLQPGEKRDVTIQLDDRAFAYWNVEKATWSVDAGKYKLHCGTSSRNIEYTLEIDIQN